MNLTLRNDNADQRLTPRGIEVGCISKDRQQVFTSKIEALTAGKEYLRSLKASSSELNAKGILIKQDGTYRTALDLIGYDHVSIDSLRNLWPLDLVKDEVLQQIQIEEGYRGYLDRQAKDIEIYKNDFNTKIPANINYDSIGSLSNELRDKLKSQKPHSIADANSIQGMTPSAIVAILHYLKRQ